MSATQSWFGLEAANCVVWLPGFHCTLAELHLALGRTEDSRAALEAAFASRKETRLDDPRLYGTQGKLLLEQAATDKAERSFCHAVEIAREQGAKSSELWTATSLARLLREQRRRDEARALLAPVYEWFTEGFDTQDLKDAKTLLEELAWKARPR